MNAYVCGWGGGGRGVCVRIDIHILYVYVCIHVNDLAFSTCKSVFIKIKFVNLTWGQLMK